MVLMDRCRLLTSLSILALSSFKEQRHQHQEVGHHGHSSSKRRDLILSLASFQALGLLVPPFGCCAHMTDMQEVSPADVAAITGSTSSPFDASSSSDISGDTFFSSMIYKRRLGAGSFKTVYLVSTPDSALSSYALAVQRVRDKADVHDGIAGIRISQELHRRLPLVDRQYFEEVLDWWFQSSPPFDFQEQAPVLSTSMWNERTQKPPRHFLGTRWMLAIKPVYDMDLLKFCQQSPELYPVGQSATSNVGVSPRRVANVPLTDEGAMTLARDLLRAGRIMETVGLVHRDIKPKNIMLRRGRPVIIDFGFADFVKRPKNGHYCIEQPGRMKGELDYVLAPDVAKFQGCQEGDAYALGKTLYEVVFGLVSHRGHDLRSGKEEITWSASQARNEHFRSLINENDACRLSRFCLKHETAGTLLEIVRGLCRTDKPLSCTQAETVLYDKLFNS